MKVLFAGGGTGGHIFPIIAIAREMKRASSGSIQLYFIGPKDEVSSEVFESEGIEIKKISSGKIRRYFGILPLISNFIDLFFKIPLGIIQSFLYIFFLSPDLIFSKGGYGAIPPVIAGRILQVPIFLHESDIVPGAANKIAGRFALEIFTSFPETESLPPEKMILVGNPVRESLTQSSTKEDIKKTLGIVKKKPVVLIMGGSQGSERINDLILEILPQLLSGFEVIHQCGLQNFEDIKVQTDFLVPDELKQNYHLLPFLIEEQLKSAYSVSDIIVSRAGSGSIFEIAAVSKPSILIPLPESAQNHQLKNAYSFSDYGACLVIEEDNLTSHFFAENLNNLIESKRRIENMAAAAKDFSRPRSAKVIAEYILEFLSQ